MEIQAQVSTALAVLHNFICIYDLDKMEDVSNSSDADNHRFGYSEAGDLYLKHDIEVPASDRTAVDAQQEILQAQAGTEEDDEHSDNNDDDDEYM